MNKKIIIGIIIAAVIVVIAGCFAYIKFFSSGAQYEKQLEQGYQLLREENYEEAIAAFDKAISLRPDQTEALLGLSEVYVALENYDDAEATLKKVLAADKNESEAYELLAEIYAKSDENEKLAGILEKGYKVTGNKDLKNQLDSILKAKASQKALEEKKQQEAKAKENTKKAAANYKILGYLGMKGSEIEKDFSNFKFIDNFTGGAYFRGDGSQTLSLGFDVAYDPTLYTGSDCIAVICDVRDLFPGMGNTISKSEILEAFNSGSWESSNDTEGSEFSGTYQISFTGNGYDVMLGTETPDEIRADDYFFIKRL